jgi:hypothetical protein
VLTRHGRVKAVPSIRLLAIGLLLWRSVIVPTPIRTWTKWHSDRFSSESFNFLLSVSCHSCSTLIHKSCRGWIKGLLETQFHRDIDSTHRNKRVTMANRRYVFLTPTLDEFDGQCHAPAGLCPGKISQNI